MNNVFCVPLLFQIVRGLLAWRLWLPIQILFRPQDAQSTTFTVVASASTTSGIGTGGGSSLTDCFGTGGGLGTEPKAPEDVAVVPSAGDVAAPLS